MTSPVPAPAAAAPGVHGGGARPSDDPAGEHVGGERRAAERAVGHAHVGDVGHVQPVRRLRLEPAFHEVGPAARALRRSGGDGRPAAAHAADPQFPHDVRHPAGSQPRANDRARVLRYPHTAMKKSAWTSRMSRASASCLAAMRLTGPDLNMRQPRGVMNPQSSKRPAPRGPARP